jgi:hypothetical protein
MPKDKPARSWVVRLKVERTVEVVCEGCTEQQARESPWDFVTGDELDIDQSDWDVVSVEPNV